MARNEQQTGTMQGGGAPEAGRGPGKGRKMVARPATLRARTEIGKNMVRLSFDAPAMVGIDPVSEAPTDRYVKLLFIPEGAGYEWPFDLRKIKEAVPGELQPVRRTYTLRNVDPAAGTFDIDFYQHGDTGLASRWAATARIGETIAYLGPGGAWRPEPGYSHFVLAGDESAAPAIAEAMAQLPAGASAQVFIEIADAGSRIRLSTPSCDLEQLPEGVQLEWVERGDAVPGAKLVEKLRGSSFPDVPTSWFVHGVAEMVKDVRRLLFVERSVAKQDASISGYWRLGATEDVWQATKRELLAEWEAQEK